MQVSCCSHCRVCIFSFVRSFVVVEGSFRGAGTLSRALSVRYRKFVGVCVCLSVISRVFVLFLMVECVFGLLVVVVEGTVRRA